MVIEKIMRDERGSVLPMITVVLILIIFVGCANISLMTMYKDRGTFRNALDAGVASSMAAAVKEKHRSTYYGYTTPCIKKIKETYTNKQGKEKTRKVCVKWAYKNAESNSKNYIYVDQSKASKIAKEYFDKNMTLNGMDNYKIVSWNYTIEYDNKRYFEIMKNRGLNWSASNHANRLTNPDNWWIEEFGDSEPKTWSSESEARLVRFPRWVRARAAVEIELPIMFGEIVRKKSFIAKYKTEFYIKELIKAEQ